MRKESERAIFFFEESDKDLIGELAEYLDSNASEIYDFFEIDVPKDKVVVNIIPTKNQYDEIFKLKYGFDADFNSRGSVLPDGTILYLSINDYQNTSHSFSADQRQKAVEGYKKTLVHEYVHCVNFLFNKKQNCSMTARYLTEGIAVYLSRQKDDEKLGFDFSLEELLTRNGNCYNGYFLLTKFFVENYDKNFVLEMFKSSRQATELLTNELYEKASRFYNHN